MYDRTALVAFVKAKGDRTPSDTARRLKVARQTGMRLWKGTHEPSRRLLANFRQEYEVPTDFAETLLYTERSA